jgi:hypothetical protein
MQVRLDSLLLQMSLVSEVQVLVDDPTATFFTAQHIYDALNQTLLEVWARTRHDVVSATLTMNTAQSLITIPPTIYIASYVEYDGKQQFSTTHGQLERYDRKWKGAALGTPTHFVLWDMNYLRPYPRPDQIYDMTMWGIGWPTEITASVTDLTLDSRLKQAIIYFAASKLLEETHPQLADSMAASADEHLRQFQKRLRNQQSHNIRRLRPANLFNRSQSGSIEIGKRL